MSKLDKNNDSLGSLPDSVVAGKGGFSEPPPPAARLTETGSSQAVKQTTALLGAGLNDPTKDDDLVDGCKSLCQLMQMRIEPGEPMRDVPRPPNAETDLIPTAEQAVATLQEEPVLTQIVSVDPRKLAGRVVRLKRARRIRDAFSAFQTSLDLIIRNYEDGIDRDLRTFYRQAAGIIDHHPRFGPRLTWLKDWATRNAQRAVESRRKNALRDARRAEEAPAPAETPVVTPAPAVTPVPAGTPAPAAVAPAPAAALPLAARAAAPAPRRTRRTRRT